MRTTRGLVHICVAHQAVVETSVDRIDVDSFAVLSQKVFNVLVGGNDSCSSHFNQVCFCVLNDVESDGKLVRGS